jgi:hypothetical protein
MAAINKQHDDYLDDVRVYLAAGADTLNQTDGPNISESRSAKKAAHKKINKQVLHDTTNDK